MQMVAFQIYCKMCHYQIVSCPEEAAMSKSKLTDGFSVKKQYAPSAASRFIRKLCTLRCLVWTSCATFLSMSLTDSMTLRLRSIILS